MDWRVIATGFSLVLLLGACRADLFFDIILDESGSGTVDLTIAADEELMAHVELDELDLSGISGTGWVVTGPTSDSTGSRMSLTKQVPAAEQLADVIAQLDTGRFLRDVEFGIDTALGTTTYSMSLTLDPQVTAADFSDSELAELLDGARFGELTEVLEQRAGSSLDEAIVVGVRVVMPDGAEVSGSSDLATVEPVVLQAETIFVAEELESRRAEALAAKDRFDRSVRRVAIYWALAAVLALGLLSVGWRRRHRLYQRG